jgi:hypothetical protein
MPKAKKFNLESAIHGLQTDMRTGFRTIEDRFETMESRFEKMENRFQSMDLKIDRLDTKFGHQGVLFEETNHKLDLALERLSPLMDSKDDHEKRISALEEQIPILKFAIKNR